MSAHFTCMECDISHLSGMVIAKVMLVLQSLNHMGQVCSSPRKIALAMTKRKGTALKKVLTDKKGNINSSYMNNILYLLKHYEYGLCPVKYLKFKVVLFLRANFQHEYSQPENAVLLVLFFFFCKFTPLFYFTQVVAQVYFAVFH